MANDSVHSPNGARAVWLISLAVFLASSVWFSGTAAAPVLKTIWLLSDVQSSWLTISVQLGFICGTLLYALLNLADIFKARNVFVASALLGALFNAGFAGISPGLFAAAVFRFLTGLTLAGVYPVGMKLVAQWFREELGWRLGIMVGALTVGTAAPFFFLALGASFNWRRLALIASVLAAVAGLIIKLALSDGPYLRGTPRFDFRAAFRVFRFREFRLQAFGYFGHMWELYAFWSLAIFYIQASFRRSGSAVSAPLVAFSVIASGVFGCVGGGWVSRAVGERTVAIISLVASGACCAFSRGLFAMRPGLFVPALLFWGFFVVSDSPQFSALAARFCPPEYTGTALTIQNGIGFAMTAIAIPFIAGISRGVGWQWAFVFLAPGPLLGALAMLRLGLTGRSAR
jgi:MFS family permease